MTELSIHKQIANRIKMQGQGAIIFPSDFADAGGAKVVKKVLLRFPLPSHF
jgi:hypothetical protein